MATRQRRQGKRRSRGTPPPSNVVEFPGGSDEVLLEESQPGAALAMESILRVIRPMLETRDFQSREEVDAFLESISEEDFRNARAKLLASDPREEAQLLAYEALLEAEDETEAAARARRALERDPQCLDALVLLAEINAGEHVGEYIDSLEEIVAGGRKALGEAFFEEHQDDLWETLESRPYLRAAFSLAEALRVSGRTDEAAGHLEELLHLNPRDHQRAREPLLGCYLTREDIEGARRLLFQFEGDESSVFLWARVLERLISEDREGALFALRHARRQNRHVEKFLTFRKAPPDANPDCYTAGSLEEAVHCLYILGLAWANYPEAIHWVRAQ